MELFYEPMSTALGLIGLVAFIVEDDGRGFNVADVALSHEGGFGLQAMRERMELIGGSLSIDSAPGRG